MAEPDEYIDFMAKYRDWVSIKRLGIHPDTKPEEVVHHLAAIRSTIDTRSYMLLGIKTTVLDQYVDSICNGAKKNYASLSSIIAKLDSADAKRAVADSCPKELAPLAQIYLLGNVLTKVGYDGSINQKVMSKVYPDLKPPKMPLGRAGKGKKEA